MGRRGSNGHSVLHLEAHSLVLQSGSQSSKVRDSQSTTDTQILQLSVSIWFRFVYSSSSFSLSFPIFSPSPNWGWQRPDGHPVSSRSPDVQRNNPIHEEGWVTAVHWLHSCRHRVSRLLIGSFPGPHPSLQCYQFYFVKE